MKVFKNERILPKPYVLQHIMEYTTYYGKSFDRHEGVNNSVELFQLPQNYLASRDFGKKLISFYHFSSIADKKRNRDNLGIGFLIFTETCCYPH